MEIDNELIKIDSDLNDFILGKIIVKITKKGKHICKKKRNINF